MKIDTKLIGSCVQRAGYVKGARIAEFVTAWVVAEALQGRPLDGPEEFAREWRGNRRTAYRRLAEFRSAFPEFGPAGVPSQLAKSDLASAEEIADRVRARQAGETRASARLASQ